MIVPRITKDPGERRQEILETAMKLFYEKGYEKTSIGDIAKAINVAQGLCYRYFPSKEALLDAAVTQYADKIAGQMISSVDSAGLTLREIITEMPTFIDIEDDDSFSYKLCHNADSIKIHNQLSMAVCAKLVPSVKKLLDKALERGEICIEDTETAASFCVYGQLGMLLRTDISGEERVVRIRNFLFKLLDMQH